MSLATESAADPALNFRVTRSRRNVAWTGAGALIVVVVLAMFPYIVYSGITAVLVQGFIVFLAVLVLRPQGLISRGAQS